MSRDWGGPPRDVCGNARTLARKKVGQTRLVATAQKMSHRGRGRPPKLTDRLAVEIAALVLAGHSTTEVARMVGVSRSSIQHWRRRAWSRAERDGACVLLERTISAGRAAAVAPVKGPSPLPPIDDVLRDLDEGWH